AQQYAPELLATMGNLGATSAGKTPGQTSAPVNYARAMPVLGNESNFGWTIRPQSNRHNAYHSPGELSRLASGGLESSDCRNTSYVVLLQTFGYPPTCT